jgi:hypothetical protein
LTAATSANSTSLVISACSPCDTAEMFSSAPRSSFSLRGPRRQCPRRDAPCAPLGKLHAPAHVEHVVRDEEALERLRAATLSLATGDALCRARERAPARVCARC